MNTVEEKLARLRHILPDVSRETFGQLIAFEQLFLKWSKAFNLAAPSTLGKFWERHVLDSCQIAAVRKPGGIWVDVGSGGGLPGIILAILVTDVTGGIVHLIESNGKKAAFLRTALNDTGAKGVVHNARIEDVRSKIGPVDVVTARALAPLDQLFELTEPWMKGGATAFFHKGRDYSREIVQARGGWAFDLLEHASVVSDDSVILEIRNLHRMGEPGGNPAQVPTI